MRQPWADQLVDGAKTTEFRTWPPHVMPPFDLAIHAGLRVEPGVDRSAVVRGAIVGVVTVSDVREVDECSHWIVDNARRCRTPVVVTGGLGLRKLPQRISRQVRRQL